MVYGDIHKMKIDERMKVGKVALFDLVWCLSKFKKYKLDVFFVLKVQNI